MRLFYAIFFDKKIIETLVQNQEYIKNYGINGRFVRRNKLHLTLKFLGETEEKNLLQIKNSVNPSEINPFKIKLSDLGVFPPKGRPRVIWQGLEGETEKDAEEMLKLKNLLEENLEDLGFEKEKRKFKPHITLVRDPKNLNKNDLDNILLKKMTTNVTSFSLMSSKLTKSGPIYDELCRYDLNTKY
ncbi:RNA 2',3'-cyclic phosphodiesterase [Natranaerofaba carboxydovora]|uniref:RNA 2',3'-cyclic phosphodiesterase n=1 Tax=Natranaerofaba carboxydovora TaxID=2742683 RepID=UPI001F1330EA|nr:RNA 2',3'-cyclic phosphodiesterase [Natranaerofaba carboxydovora]UMZ72816.1 RNA 2',3'-cyclic phosphodiesterase [Natranaerofaba carboxydovora]